MNSKFKIQNSKLAFTLVEVLIVVIIIGILSAIVIPQYKNTLEKARSAEALNILGSLRSAMHRYWYDQVALGNYTSLTTGSPAGLNPLDIDNPNNVTSRLWDYEIKEDNGDNNNMGFILRAERTKNSVTYWIEIDQDGNTAKCTELGGTGTPL